MATHAEVARSDVLLVRPRSQVARARRRRTSRRSETTWQTIGQTFPGAAGRCRRERRAQASHRLWKLRPITITSWRRSAVAAPLSIMTMMGGWTCSYSRATLSAQARPTATNRLYHNNRDGSFTDVTEKAGLVHNGWSCGVCVGDYNNDGFEDIFVSGWGQNLLYRNNGDGTFTDVTKSTGLGRQRASMEYGLQLCRLQPRRPSGPVRLQLSGVRSRARAASRQQSIVHVPRNRSELRAARVQSWTEQALSQQRRWHIHRCQCEGWCCLPLANPTVSP